MTPFKNNPTLKSYPPLVKFCGLSSRHDIRLSAKLGVTYVGFMFVEKSPRKLSLPHATKLALYAKRFPLLLVGVFANPSLSFLQSTLKAVPLDFIQLHGDETPEICQIIENTFSLPVIKAFGISNPIDFSHTHLYNPSFFLFDSKPPSSHAPTGGHGQTFNWNILSSYKKNTPAFLAGGLNPRNIKKALRKNTLHALDVSSGIEYPKNSKRAYTKNPLAMTQFMRAVHLSSHPSIS